ncbi:SAM-dependent methyltransferase [Kitasatospora sp. GP30]|uniref:methyltransferase n=1 Tax=Kitasatospora sp. GP30 TaxID=3035084 RepID=UPI000CBB42FA|nr:methyltransferase [Kitasatospora sp. GP30]MDH6142378.1 SAM-dependent methyltransferase [Kitasatospora sp. GP30]
MARTTPQPQSAPPAAHGPMPQALESAVYGLFATCALDLAVRHGVFRELTEHGPSRSAELATALGVDQDTLGRLLTLLRSLEVLAADGEGRYTVPDQARPYLDGSDTRYLGGFVHHLVDSTFGRLRHLESCLTRGKAAADATRPEPFAEIYRDEEATDRFLDAMWQLSFDVSGELVEAAGLEQVHHLVDVGGAGGPFSVAALLRRPGLRATVFDLPQVAQRLQQARQRYRLGARLAFIPGDFHRDELPPGDCLAFGYILSDWTDDTCLELLRKAHRALAPGGLVLVMERLFDEDGYRPLATAAMNLSMQAETQGRHRTAAEYLALLRRAGFTGCEVRRSSREKHLVIGRRADNAHPPGRWW